MLITDTCHLIHTGMLNLCNSEAHSYFFIIISSSNSSNNIINIAVLIVMLASLNSLAPLKTKTMTFSASSSWFAN